MSDHIRNVNVVLQIRKKMWFLDKWLLDAFTLNHINTL